MAKGQPTGNKSNTLHLDGNQAMKNSKSEWPLRANQSDFDLLKRIRVIKTELPVKVNWGWVRGHQDEHIPFEDLDPISQDNVLVDNIAKGHLQELPDNQVEAQPPKGKGTGWYFAVKNIRWTRINEKELYRHMIKGKAKLLLKSN